MVKIVTVGKSIFSDDFPVSVITIFTVDHLNNIVGPIITILKLSS